MLASAWVAVAVVALDLVLLASLAFRREPAADRAGKILLFVAALVLPALAVLATAGQNLQSSTEVSFCLSCHEMGKHGESLRSDDEEILPAVHYQNNYVRQDHACYDCHTDYSMYGTLKAKIGGMKHVWVHYLGTPPERLKTYQPYDTAICLRCHGPSTRFQKKKAHREEADTLDKIRTGQRSCLEQGCHAIMHGIYEEE